MPDEDYELLSAGFLEHKRLVPERFRRIWQLVEDIARSPGKSRKELAAQFALSERQVQADLNVIRREMGLPLVRRHGYRFLTDGQDGGPPFSLAEAQLHAPGYTLRGGTNEILRGIVARGLGLR